MFDQIQCKKKLLKVFNNNKFIKRHGFQASKKEFWDSSAFFFMKLNQLRPQCENCSANSENGGKNSNFLKVRSKKWKRISKMIEKCWSDMKK